MSTVAYSQKGFTAQEPNGNFTNVAAQLLPENNAPPAAWTNNAVTMD